MSHTAPSRPRRTWPWVVLVVVVVAAIVSGVSVLSVVLGGTGPTASAPSPSATVGSAIASGVDVAGVEQAIDDGDFGAIDDDLASSVHVTIVGGDLDDDRSPAEVEKDLAFLAPAGRWSWDANTEEIAPLRAGAYGSWFGAGTVVGASENGYLVALTTRGTKVTGILMTDDVAPLVEPTAAPTP